MTIKKSIKLKRMKAWVDRKEDIRKHIESGDINIKEIARDIGISHTTVRYYLVSLCEEYQVQTLTQLAIKLHDEARQTKIKNLPTPLLCDCGNLARWRGFVVIRNRPDAILLCDDCKSFFNGKTEPAIMIVSVDDYATLYAIASRNV